MTESIPDCIKNLRYTTHAQRARCTEINGFVAHIPHHFYRSGCKSCTLQPDGILDATYIYNDDHDLTLIINPVDGIVITLYLDRAKNTGIYKGRFFLEKLRNTQHLHK